MYKRAHFKHGDFWNRPGPRQLAEAWEARSIPRGNRASVLGTPAVMPDPNPDEPRMRAIGKTAAGRYVFLVFMLRDVGGQRKLRPISERYMHQKEVDHYEEQV